VKPMLKYFIFVARLIIGILFIYASWHKLLDPAAFAVSVRNYAIIPPEYSNLVALTLPWIEMIAGILLIVGVQTKPASLLTTGMLAVFFGAILYAYSVGLDIDCGCFGTAASSPGHIGIYHLFRDGSLLVLSMFIFAMDKGMLSLANLRGPRRTEPVS
jgi:uncharacterized membrane protein YphA (DoxX/SURF4 family)